MQAIRDGAARLDFDHRAVRVRITGSEAFEHESIDAGLSDVPRLLAGALVMVAIILFAALGSVRLLVASLCVLFAGLVGTAAFAAAAVGGLNMISVAFAILYVGLGIDYAIHFCLNYVEARGETGSHIEALRLTAQDLKNLGVCDRIIPEPMGGAHRDRQGAIAEVGKNIATMLAELNGKSGKKLVADRRKKFLEIGRHIG